MYFYLSVIFLIFVSLKSSFSQETIKFGFTAVINQKDSAVIKNFLDYLSKKTGYKFTPFYLKSYNEMNYMLSKGFIEMGFICGAPYVKERKFLGVELSVAPTVNGKPVYYSYVITRREKKYKSIFDFYNKPYAFSDPDSNSGSIVPSYIIKKKGYNFRNFFRPIVYTYSHVESIYAVYYGLVEGASVDSIVYHQVEKSRPEIISHIKIVDKFGPYPTTPIVIRKDMPYKVKFSIRKTLLNMRYDPRGKEILQKLGIDGFTTLKDEDYNIILKMIKYLR